MMVLSLFRPPRYKKGKSGRTKNTNEVSTPSTIEPVNKSKVQETPSTSQNAPKIKRRNNNTSFEHQTVSSSSTGNMTEKLDRLQQALATTSDDDSHFVVDIKCSSSGQIEVNKRVDRSKLSSGGMLNNTMSSNGSKDSIPWENDINAIADEYANPIVVKNVVVKKKVVNSGESKSFLKSSRTESEFSDRNADIQKLNDKVENFELSSKEESHSSHCTTSPSLTMLPPSVLKMPTTRHPSSASSSTATRKIVIIF